MSLLATQLFWGMAGDRARLRPEVPSPARNGVPLSHLFVRS
jgi:hypothetical protein